MAKTNAEIQAAYRRNRPYARNFDGEMRLNTWVLSSAKMALSRMALHFGVSEKALLERLILDEQERLTRGMTDEEFDRYYELRSKKELRNG